MTLRHKRAARNFFEARYRLGALSLIWLWPEKESVPCDSAQPNNIRFRRLQSSAFIIKDSGRMAADWKPSTIVFHVAPILFKTDGSVRPPKNIDTQRSVLIVD